MDTQLQSSPVPVKPEVESPARIWWETYRFNVAYAKDLHTQIADPERGGTSSFCDCCGAKVWDERSDQSRWHKDYLHVGLRITAEQFKQKLNVVNDPTVVSYEIHHKGVPFSFLWKDE